MMPSKLERLTFAYLMYTDGGQWASYGKQLLRIFRTKKAALAYMESMTSSRDYAPAIHSNRIAQRINNLTGQYWFVEKHVMCDQ